MNFIVWKRAGRGPAPQLCDLDPRSSMDWGVNEQSTIAVISLPPHQRAYTLDILAELYPCPAYEVFR